MSIPVATAVVPARSSICLLARIRGAAGALLTQASLASLGYAVFDLTAGLTVTTSTQSLSIAACVSNSLVQNDPRWTKDSAVLPGRDGSYGYNFLAVVPGTNFINFDLASNLGAIQVTPHVYQVDVRFQGVDGSVFSQPFRLSTAAVFGAV